MLHKHIVFFTLERINFVKFNGCIAFNIDLNYSIWLLNLFENKKTGLVYPVFIIKVIVILRPLKVPLCNSQAMYAWLKVVFPHWSFLALLPEYNGCNS